VIAVALPIRTPHTHATIRTHTRTGGSAPEAQAHRTQTVGQLHLRSMASAPEDIATVIERHREAG